MSRWSIVPPISLVLLGAVVVPFMTVMGFAGWYSIRILEDQTHDRLEEDIELIARAIQLPLSHALERGHQGTVEQALESAFTINRVYGVYVYDGAGNTIYSSGTRGAAMPRDRAAELAIEREQISEFSQAGREQVFSFFVPLIDHGERVIGLLQITRKGSEFDEYLARVRTTSLQILVGAGLLMGVIVLLAHSWWIARPIWRFERSLQSVEQGDIAHRLDIRGPRELRTLAQGINDMLDAIVASTSRLAQEQAKQQALQEQLYQSQKMAALGQLAAGVAHELGSPLSIIDGKIQQMQRIESVPNQQKEDIATIQAQSKRMEGIIRQLLDYGSSGTSNRKDVSADYPLKSVLRMEEVARRDDIEVTVEMAPRATTTRVAIDPIRMEQALANLLRNALQATRTRLVISCHVDDQWIRYCFEDDGDGVAAEAEQHIFDPFFTTKAPGEGTGLGLALAHAVAREHHGSVDFENLEPCGVRFCLAIPVGDAND